MSEDHKLRSRKLALIAGGLLVVVLLISLQLAGRMTPPANETRRLLEGAQAAIVTYAEEQGAAPASLEAVVEAGYLEAFPTDRSGNPLIFTRLGAGKFEIKTLGPDGKEGGMMFKRDHKIRFEIPSQEPKEG